ncbi:hypothetical protein CFOL_v3_14733 [Cephalotus follicularis]|uniref:Uncharacterized protein n=1 Tax=Cephalotus follicularis TaxID=3775 RepID=A0A1Q3BTG2_CEPFO|nr:hypothetical protein CFOL_v3_14733 [Cephalotus follicularis]
MNVWKNTFLFQNIEDRHSWFFCFDKTFKKQTIPYWFVDWWCFYGPIEEILPPPIIEAFSTFTKSTESLTLCPTMLSFFIHCKLSWIMYWDYCHTPLFRITSRQAYVVISELGINSIPAQFINKFAEAFDKTKYKTSRPHVSHTTCG